MVDVGSRPVKAVALADAGCMGLQTLLKSDEYHSQLPLNVLTGLKYYDHLDKPTSREQVEQVLVSPRFL